MTRCSAKFVTTCVNCVATVQYAAKGRGCGFPVISMMKCRSSSQILRMRICDAYIIGT